jgi:predicted AlkP superfamily phosphohydrolase/phosphomutase
LLDGERVSPGAPRIRRKVLVIGLDSAPPELVFDQERETLPNLHRLMRQGCYGELESTIPPITVPAWMSMMTGLDPGELGVYGFRNRSSYTYSELSIVDSSSIRADTVWDILSRAGKKVIVVGVPPSYPPKPVNGSLVGCFLTPDIDREYTYPPALARTIERLVGRYLVDVEEFRTDDKERVLRQIYEMTEKRFRVVRHLVKEQEWDFCMMVEMGPDRIQHGFWKFHDPTHPKHQPGSPFEHAIRDYYRYLDREIGELLSLVEEETVVMVVSDHGAKRMIGGICLNEWLIREGYLTLREQPSRIVTLDKAEIDWRRTRAWGSGGYYGRLFLNVRDREPNGLVEPAEYERLRDELIERLSHIPDEKGNPIPTRVYKPQEIYRECRGIPPDLLIYFGDLDWRAVGSIGHRAIHVFENDTGPDDSNHARRGIFILSDPLGKARGEQKDLQIMDCAPTLLRRFGILPPPGMGGRPIE